MREPGFPIWRGVTRELAPKSMMQVKHRVYPDGCRGGSTPSITRTSTLLTSRGSRLLSEEAQFPCSHRPHQRCLLEALRCRGREVWCPAYSHESSGRMSSALLSNSLQWGRPSTRSLSGQSQWEQDVLVLLSWPGPASYFWARLLMGRGCPAGLRIQEEGLRLAQGSASPGPLLPWGSDQSCPV